MGLMSWIAKLLGFGPLTSSREEEQDFPLYLTRLEDRQVLNASFAVTGGNALNLTNFTDTGNTKSTGVTVSESGTNYVFTLTGGNGTWLGTNGGGVSGAGT